MTLPRPIKNKRNAARLALVVAWVVCLGSLFRPVAVNTIEGFLEPKNEMFYGWFVLPVAVCMALSLWKKLRLAAGCPAWGGLVLLAFSFALLALGKHTGRLSCGQLAMIASIPAVAWAGWGRDVARLLFFPVFFLLFIIPLNLPGLDVESLSWVSGNVSSALMNGVGFTSDLFYEMDVMGELRKGVFLTTPSNAFQFEVADVCSGRRSIAAIFLVTAIYGFFHYQTLPRIFTLMACSVPFVLLANAARIIAMCGFAFYHGQEKTMAVFHDTNGLAMFGIAALLLVKWGDRYICKIGKDPADISSAPPAS